LIRPLIGGEFFICVLRRTRSARAQRNNQEQYAAKAESLGTYLADPTARKLGFFLCSFPLHLLCWQAVERTQFAHCVLTPARKVLVSSFASQGFVAVPRSSFGNSLEQKDPAY